MPFIWQQPERFRLATFEAPQDWGDERRTVDHRADLDFVRAVYDRLGVDGAVGVREILALLDREPQIRESSTPPVR